MFEILQKLVEKHGIKKVVEVACMLLNSTVAAFDDTDDAPKKSAPKKSSSKKSASKKSEDQQPPVETENPQLPVETETPTATFPEFITECTKRGMSMNAIDDHCVKMVGVKLAEVLPNGLESKIPLLIRSLP